MDELVPISTGMYWQPQASSASCVRAHIPNRPERQLGKAGPSCPCVPPQTPLHPLQRRVSAGACPMANSLETSVTSLLCTVCSASAACAATQADQHPWMQSLFLVVEPCQATQLGLGCVPAQWEGQDLALSVNSPPCLPLKVFSKSSCGYFTLGLAAVAFCVQRLLMSAEAAPSASDQGAFCTSRSGHCTLACIDSRKDSNHALETGLMIKAPESKEQKKHSEDAFCHCLSLLC